MSIGDKAHSASDDWTKLAGGLPSTARIQDPAAKAVCDAIAQALRYLVLKVQDIRVPDPRMPRTDVSKRMGTKT